MSKDARLADLLRGLSLTSDLGFGLPAGTAVRACIVATALARRLGLSEEEASDTFYAALLLHVGCISMSHETSVLFGNELSLTRAVAMTDLGDPEDLVTTLIPAATEGMGPPEVERFSQAIITSGPSFGRLYDTASGEVSRATARRMGLPDTTQRALYEAGEAWHGDAGPQGLKAGEICPAARIVRLAYDAAFFADIGTVELAVSAVRRRAGGVLDPEISEAFVADAGALMAEASTGDPLDRVLEIEPEPRVQLDREGIARVAAAHGDAADLKAPFMHGHSSEVAKIATEAAARSGLDAGARWELEIAALLHDVGRVAVSDVIWEKPGSLTASEWETVRMHAYHSERIMTLSETLQPMARTAGMHHERLDGSGYHRGSSRSEIPIAARVLAAADAFVAMTQRRPYRPAFEPAQAADELSTDARAGRLDPDAATAVLEAAGHARSSTKRAQPAGLSEREVEVLVLVAEGLSNPEIVERLGVSRRTAEHHVQHIYVKIGVSTRPGAALFAVQHGLFEPINR